MMKNKTTVMTRAAQVVQMHGLLLTRKSSYLHAVTKIQMGQSNAFLFVGISNFSSKKGSFNFLFIYVCFVGKSSAMEMVSTV